MIKTFTAYRKADISSTHDSNQLNPPDEPQFEGCVFSDGSVALRWLTAKRSTSVWQSLDDAMAIHGHPEYGTVIVWDELATPVKWVDRPDKAGWWWMSHWNDSFNRWDKPISVHVWHVEDYEINSGNVKWLYIEEPTPPEGR